jgi:hypothetical protein
LRRITVPGKDCPEPTQLYPAGVRARIPEDMVRGARSMALSAELPEYHPLTEAAILLFCPANLS